MNIENNIRRATSALSPELCKHMQIGIMSYTYRDIMTFKCPFDLAIYSRLFSELRPQTIVEFGSYKGGSALWIADTLQALGLGGTKIQTLDLEFMHDFQDPRIEFIKCDISDITNYITSPITEKWEKPLLFIDDASHQYQHSLNILNFFDTVSASGDYIIVEDGIISIMGAEAQYDGGPHRAIFEFLANRGNDYEIDRARCDYFGHNVTWNIDGYIRRL